MSSCHALSLTENRLHSCSQSFDELCNCRKTTGSGQFVFTANVYQLGQHQIVQLQDLSLKYFLNVQQPLLLKRRQKCWSSFFKLLPKVCMKSDDGSWLLMEFVPSTTHPFRFRVLLSVVMSSTVSALDLKKQNLRDLYFNLMPSWFHSLNFPPNWPRSRLQVRWAS